MAEFINISERYGERVPVTIADYEDLNPDGTFEIVAGTIREYDEEGNYIETVAREVEDEPIAAPTATMLKDFDDAQQEAAATSGAASLLKDFDASETVPARHDDTEAMKDAAIQQVVALRAENEALKQQLAAARAALEAVVNVEPRTLSQSFNENYAIGYNTALTHIKMLAARATTHRTP